MHKQETAKGAGLLRRKEKLLQGAFADTIEAVDERNFHHNKAGDRQARDLPGSVTLWRFGSRPGAQDSMNAPAPAASPPSCAAPPAAAQTMDFSPPVQRQRKGFFKLLGEVLEDGGPGYLQFAITNLCNARCDFCNFAVDKLNPAERRSVTLQEAREAIDICAANHIGYLLFVGGEPLVHRDLRGMVGHAAQHGITPMICTNGALWTERNMRELASDGLSSVIMSIDATDALRHEQNRGLPDVCRKIKHANEVFDRLGIQSTASITASKLIDDYDKLPEFLRSLGFRSCTFSYPLSSLASSYLSFSESGLVSFTTEELIEVFEKIKGMKRRTGFPVINPAESLTDMQRHLRKEPERFGCLGGHKYFYLDWHLNLYRCHYWETPMCHISQFDRSKLIRDGCTRCMIDCYRDPSVLQFVAVNLSDAWHDLRRGKLGQAAGHIFDRRNLTSLKAVLENRKWIGEV
jgi:MoaA/NifB/PqqE/SkfB family radical SAM enzyme